MDKNLVLIFKNSHQNKTTARNAIFWQQKLIYCKTGATGSYIRVLVEVSWNVRAQLLKPDFVFRQNGRFHLNRRGRQFSRLLAAEVCASAVVMLDTPCSVVVWRVLDTHSIRRFPLHFPTLASPCAITFQLDSTLAVHVRIPFSHISTNNSQSTAL